MIRRYRYLGLAVIAAILLLISYLYRNTFTENLQGYKDYIFVYQDSVINQIDTASCLNYYKDDNYLSIFNLVQKDFSILIWDLKSYQAIDFQHIDFRPNDNSSCFQLDQGETLFKYSCPEIKAPFKIHFENQLNISTDERSKILFPVETNYCKGVYGEIKNISLNDGKNDPIVMNLEKEHVYSMILAYKIRKKTLLILIVSNHPFDKSVLNLFKKEI